MPFPPLTGAETIFRCSFSLRTKHAVRRLLDHPLHPRWLHLILAEFLYRARASGFGELLVGLQVLRVPIPNETGEIIAE